MGAGVRNTVDVLWVQRAGSCKVSGVACILSWVTYMLWYYCTVWGSSDMFRLSFHHRASLTPFLFVFFDWQVNTI